MITNNLIFEDIRYFAQKADLFDGKSKMQPLKQLQIMIKAFDVYISEQIKQLESL